MPEYLTARLNRLIAERRAAGRDVISLGVGDPDLPPSVAAREALAAAVRRDDVAHYPTNRGVPELREAVARFYDRRFGVSSTPRPRSCRCSAPRRGSHTSPSRSSTRATSRSWPTPATRSTWAGRCSPAPSRTACRCCRSAPFSPTSAPCRRAVRDRANLLILGYPNNPTGAVVEDDLFERLVAYGVPVCHDNAYSEITFDGYVAPSFLQTPGAREAGIELLSLSKAFSLPGWRIAFAVGNAAMVGNLLRLKTNVDSGMFTALQYAAIALLDSDPAERTALRGDVRPPPRPGRATRSPRRASR